MSPTSTPEGAKIVEEIRRTLRGLVIATLILYVALAILAGFSYHTSRQNQEAVCNLRGDLQHRIQGSETFLADHPDAVQKLGFTVAQVQKEIDNQRRTLRALSAVSCD